VLNKLFFFFLASHTIFLDPFCERLVSIFLSSHQARVAKMDVFFGPSVWCEVVKVSGEEKLVGVKMTTGTRPEAAAAPAVEAATA